jgi:hypothetical protein
MDRGFPACQSLLHAHDGRETGLESRRTDVIPIVRRLQEGDQNASETKPSFSSFSPLDVIFLLASVYRQLPLGPFRVSYFRAYCGPLGSSSPIVDPTNRPPPNIDRAPETQKRRTRSCAPGQPILRCNAESDMPSSRHGSATPPPKRVPDSSSLQRILAGREQCGRIQMGIPGRRVVSAFLFPRG